VSLPRAFLLLTVTAGILRAQDVPPTLGTVVVIAERAATPINQSTAAITRLSAADLGRLPYATLADVLRQVPGFAVVDFDGLGRDPQLMVRGFYGGGEADYVVVMVDGRAVNLVHNGTIAWETLPPLSSIESIEIVRGSASALHGDAAVAGVINIVTRRSSQQTAGWRVGTESYSGFSASADVSPMVFDRPFNASVGFDRTSGFREHAGRAAASGRASMRLSSSLRTSLHTSWRDFEEPGPLLESLSGDARSSDSRFRFDGGHDIEWGARVDYDASLGAGGGAHTTFRGGGRRATLVRTLPLAPDFGDTKERILRTSVFGVTTQADLNATILPIDRASVGASAHIETIDSRYFSGMAIGDRALEARSDGNRGSVGAFVHLTSRPREWLRWTFGVRGDLLRDSFSPDNAQSDYDASHFAFSPKAGLNVRYAASPRASGYVWASASRTFKAPTIDQLFDQRPIPIPFPPFSLTTSNPELNPQRGTSVEGGLYHDASLSSTNVGLTLTVYQIAMKDELDLDLQAFKYVNIARSRHRGLEAGLTLSRGVASGFASMTLQNAVARSGANTGNQLKAIPRQLFSTGVTLSATQIGTASLALTRTADMYIDDANTRRIPSWTRIDVQLSRTVGSIAIMLGARNLLDERFNSTGFLDPSGSGEAYYYPAAGRVITLGVRNGR